MPAAPAHGSRSCSYRLQISLALPQLCDCLASRNLLGCLQLFAKMLFLIRRGYSLKDEFGEGLHRPYQLPSYAEPRIISTMRLIASGLDPMGKLKVTRLQASRAEYVSGTRSPSSRGSLRLWVICRNPFHLRRIGAL